MKVKVLSRNPEDYVRETKYDIQRGKLYFKPKLTSFMLASSLSFKYNIGHVFVMLNNTHSLEL